MTANGQIAERLHCIHVLERRMLRLDRDLRYIETDDAQRMDWQTQHKALSEAATELRKIELAETDCNKLAHRIIELRDALEPFAEYGRLVDRLANPVDDNETPGPLPATLQAHGKLVTVGACRNAYRALMKGN